MTEVIKSKLYGGCHLLRHEERQLTNPPGEKMDTPKLKSAIFPHVPSQLASLVSAMQGDVWAKEEMFSS